MASLWFTLIGALLVLMSLIGLAVDRWPLSPALIYLLIGLALGPLGVGILELQLERDTLPLRFAFEIAVLISLFSVGLKMRVPLSDKLWRLPVMLATLSMLVTIAALALLGVGLLNFSPAIAVLFGAIVAPTDPVLASDVQVKDPFDQDKVRFSVTGEGGLNDGMAFPFVLLGLGLLNLHDLGAYGSSWWLIDVLWGVVGGLLIGALSGIGVGRLVLWLRTRRNEPFSLEEFLALGLIAFSYGLACMLHTFGFLAVLAAGIAMRRLEYQRTESALHTPQTAATDVARTTSDHMVQSVLGFNERFERIAEVMAVLLLGGLMSSGYFSLAGLAVAACLMLVIRPASVFLGCVGSGCSWRQRWLISWFGVRGVGSLYYLMYAIESGLHPHMAEKLLPVVLTVIATSIVVHGISGTPLMVRYARRQR